MKPENDRKREGRFARFRTTARSTPWATLAVANIIPVMVTVGLAVSYYQGTISFVPDAESVMPSLLLLGGSLVVLVFLAWIVAPLVFPAVRSASEFVSRQSRGISNGGMFSIVARLPLLMGGILVHAILYANMILVCLLVGLDIIAVAIGLFVFVWEIWRIRG